jgi:hypothetical protein
VRYQDDTVLRLIEQMGALVRGARTLMREGATDAPYLQANEAVGLALGVDPDLISRLSPQALTSMLEISNHDERVLLLLAEALELESAICQSRGDLMEAELRADQAAAVLHLLDPARAN